MLIADDDFKFVFDTWKIYVKYYESHYIRRCTIVYIQTKGQLKLIESRDLDTTPSYNLKNIMYDYKTLSMYKLLLFTE